MTSCILTMLYKCQWLIEDVVLENITDGYPGKAVLDIYGGNTQVWLTETNSQNTQLPDVTQFSDKNILEWSWVSVGEV